jgi:hypothetical protein
MARLCRLGAKFAIEHASVRLLFGIEDVREKLSRAGSL